MFFVISYQRDQLVKAPPGEDGDLGASLVETFTLPGLPMYI